MRVEFVVGSDGRTRDVKAMRGPQIFHKAAVDAVLKFRFRPAESNGKKVAVRMTIPITFKLD